MYYKSLVLFDKQDLRLLFKRKTEENMSKRRCKSNTQLDKRSVSFIYDILCACFIFKLTYISF